MGLNELTTIRFNQLDHVLLNDEKFPVNFSTSFINHTTDHHTIVVRIAKDGNRFKQSFLEKISLDPDFETKIEGKNISKTKDTITREHHDLETRTTKRIKLEKDFPDKKLRNRKQNKIE